MKPRHLAMGAALVATAALVAFGDNTPEDTVAEPVERAQAPAARPAPRAAQASVDKAPAILRLVDREVLIGDSGERFNQDAHGVFGRQDWTPPPPPVVQQPAPPPPPPSAPPLPFTFIGKSLQDGAWEIYLARGDRTYSVRDQTVIDGVYRVDAIRPPVLTLTYLPLNQVQQLNIGVFD